MKKYSVLSLILAFLLLPYSCKDDPIPDFNDQTEVEILNEWIWDVMTDVYLWANDINTDLYPTDKTDPEEFFFSLLHEDDRFSWIVDDYETLVNSFNNIELSSGISPYFIRVGDTDNVIVVVEYVSKGSPADLAEIKRGDIINKINGTALDITNYSALFFTEELRYGFVEYLGDTLVATEREVSLTALVIEQNPIVHHEVINYQDTEIGYIVYTGFSIGENNQWEDSIDVIFSRK